MLVEGIYIYLFVVKVYNVSDKMHRYHVFCWGEEQEMNKWDRTWRNTWGNISILICENQTEQKDLNMALFLILQMNTRIFWKPLDRLELYLS